jgi:aryl-alcohol dehydrogenase-like predicted oxidoreductase/spore coat polysaccharide biosynthesis protein SpsF (cytidylyltransferase family)
VNITIIIQARTTSKRLPGKALLPIAGYPAAILAALRGSNRNHAIIFATSDDGSDDRLAQEARQRNLKVFRGPLDDVLARYALAVAELPDDSVIVRLTADNVVPDGAFVSELAQTLVSSGYEYVGIDTQVSRTPYGLFGEAFLVSALRKAAATASDPSDREHVGPWMKRNCRSTMLPPKLFSIEDFSHLRCTIDTREDYQRVLQLFEGTRNPLEVGWLELVRRLPSVSDQQSSRIPCREISGVLHSELTLGTAQLGMDYGRVNDSGQPARSEAVAIVHRAIAQGVTALDTARAYQDSEAVLGEALTVNPQLQARVITKIDLSDWQGLSAEREVRRRVDDSVSASCCALQKRTLDTLLLHLWEHRHVCSGAAWRRMLELRDSGKVAVLGASVYEPDQALEALRDKQIKHLQIPINVLDWRWAAAGVDQAIADRPDVIVHARSVLLQGILAHSAERWPQVAGFDVTACKRKLLVLAKKFGRDGVVDLCVAYVRSLNWITSVIIGCETPSQLEENVNLFSKSKLTAEEREELEETLPRAPDTLLNPSKWTSAGEQVAVYAS